MTLVPNWRRVLARAWSVRLLVFGAVIGGVGAALPGTIGLSWQDAARVMMGGILVSLGAVVARVVDQPKTLGDE